MANSLAHSKWVCKYHVVFTPKYRRKIDYWGMREDIRDIIPFPIKTFVIDRTVSSWYYSSQEVSGSTSLPLMVRTPFSSFQAAAPVSGTSARAGSAGSASGGGSAGSSRTGSPVTWV